MPERPRKDLDFDGLPIDRLVHVHLRLLVIVKNVTYLE